MPPSTKPDRKVALLFDRWLTSWAVPVYSAWDSATSRAWEKVITLPRLSDACKMGDPIRSFWKAECGLTTRELFDSLPPYHSKSDLHSECTEYASWSKIPWTLTLQSRSLDKGRGNNTPNRESPYSPTRKGIQNLRISQLNFQIWTILIYFNLFYTISSIFWLQFGFCIVNVGGLLEFRSS